MWLFQYKFSCSPRKQQIWNRLALYKRILSLIKPFVFAQYWIWTFPQSVITDQLQWGRFWFFQRKMKLSNLIDWISSTFSKTFMSIRQKSKMKWQTFGQSLQRTAGNLQVNFEPLWWKMQLLCQTFYFKSTDSWVA